MERIKEAAKILKLYPKLRLGEKTDHGVKATGPHTVKLIAEPNTIMMNKGGKMVKGFKFLVEEDGVTYKWNVPIMNESGDEGHYLIDRLNTMDVQVGEEITLEMKKRGPKNYIEVTRPGEEEDDNEVPPEAEESAEEVAQV